MPANLENSTVATGLEYDSFHSNPKERQCQRMFKLPHNFSSRKLEIPGTFHAKMGSIKDRNGMDLTEAEDIKKRWQEYTEELYKKDLHDPDNHDGVITHLEPDILECKVNGP